MISINDAIKDLNKKNVEIAEFDDNGNLVPESDTSIAVTTGEIIIMLEKLQRYETIIQPKDGIHAPFIGWGKIIENKKEQLIDMLKIAHFASLENRDIRYLVTLDSNSTVSIVQLKDDIDMINYKPTTETLGLHSFCYSSKLPNTSEYNKKEHQRFCSNIDKSFESIVRFW